MKFLCTYLGIGVIFAVGSILWADPSVVKVIKGESGWQLKVDGNPFFIKGVGCNRAEGEKGEDYLRMAKDMGANAVRTWGDAPSTYLDKAQGYGLKVNLGIWLNPIRSGTSESYLEAGHCAGLKNLALNYVREMKDHPALLTWNIGNEVFAFTESEDERKAFGAFLEDLIQAVHQEDPKHPVVYASSDIKDFPSLQEMVPSIDIVGLNTYGSLAPAMAWLRDRSYDKPLVVTEFGPLGPWDVSKDKNQIAYDPSDQFKANNYASLWRQIEHAKGPCIGGFAFVLGEQRNSDSLTWWNINFGTQKRDAYWTLHKAFTGTEPEHRPPKITLFSVEGSTAVVAGSRVLLRTTAASPGEAPLAYSYFVTGLASDPLIVEPPKFYPAEVEESGPGAATIKAPDDPGIYRVYVSASDNYGNTAIADRSIQVIGR